jgi:hypothetical protein
LLGNGKHWQDLACSFFRPQSPRDDEFVSLHVILFGDIFLHDSGSEGWLTD